MRPKSGSNIVGAFYMPGGVRVATSRTGTTTWLNLRRKTLWTAQRTGITNCRYCGTELDYRQSLQPNSAEPDHIIPHANGGTDTADNLQVICRTCNIKKSNRGIKPRTELRTSRSW